MAMRLWVRHVKTLLICWGLHGMSPFWITSGYKKREQAQVAPIFCGMSLLNSVGWTVRPLQYSYPNHHSSDIATMRLLLQSTLQPSVQQILDPPCGQTNGQLFTLQHVQTCSLFQNTHFRRLCQPLPQKTSQKRSSVPTTTTSHIIFIYQSP